MKKKYEHIRDLAHTQGLSVRQLARKAGMVEQDLYQVIAGKRPFFPGWRKRVAEALGVDENELIEGGDDDGANS